MNLSKLIFIVVELIYFFPHHENEASQTRCVSGQNLAKYWMHNGFVNINGEKMSKSLGNLILKRCFEIL